METTRIEKRVGIRASSERLWDLLSDLGNWGQWNPYETDITGTLGFGTKLELTEALPDLPPRQTLVQLGDWQPHSKLIWSERRGFLFATTRYFTLDVLDKQACILSHGLIFTGLRAELFHDKHKAKIREAYEVIGNNLKALAEAEA